MGVWIIAWMTEWLLGAHMFWVVGWVYGGCLGEYIVGAWIHSW